MKKYLSILFILLFTMMSCSTNAKEPKALYYGIPLDGNDRNFNFFKSSDNNKKQSITEKYETEYFLYSDGAFLGRAKGKIEEGSPYCWDIYFPAIKYDHEIEISQKYNPYPREISYIKDNFQKEFDKSSEVISLIDKQFEVHAVIKEMICTDLDNDGKKEYLGMFVDKKKCFFTKCLIDSNNKIISYVLAYQAPAEKVEQAKSEWDEFNASEWFDGFIEEYNLQSSGEIVDINNDKIMEIIVELPVYDGFNFKVFTFNNGKFDGEFITKSNVFP